MGRIEVSELQAGDAIIFTNKYYHEGATVSTPIAERYQNWTYVDHIAMFSHLDEDGTPVVLHAVQGENGRPSGLVKSTLQTIMNRSEVIPCNEGLGKKTVKYDVEYSVFRFADSAVAQKACALMSLWCKYNIPYDAARLNEKIRLENEQEYEAQDFYALASNRYTVVGKFRALKYAVRRAGPITQSHLSGSDHGLTCSMSFVLAYQVAELDEDVDTLEYANNRRKPGQVRLYNSDKHAVFVAEHLPSDYVNYLNEIKNKNNEKKSFYVTSLQFCKPGFNIFKFSHKSFRIDCKTIGAAGIHYLFEQQANWKELGSLKLDTKYFTEEQKIAYRAERQRVQEQADLLRAVYAMQGLFGSHLSENTRKFSEQLNVKTDSITTSTSQPTTPEKPIEMQMNSSRTDPAKKSAHSRRLSNELSENHNVKRKLQF